MIQKWHKSVCANLAWLQFYCHQFQVECFFLLLFYTLFSTCCILDIFFKLYFLFLRFQPLFFFIYFDCIKQTKLQQMKPNQLHSIKTKPNWTINNIFLALCKVLMHQFLCLLLFHNNFNCKVLFTLNNMIRPSCEVAQWKKTFACIPPHTC